MELTQFKDPRFLNFPTATVATLFWARVAKDSKKLSALQKTDSGWMKWTWLEIADHVEKTALGLKALGIGPQDRVGIFLPTWIEWEIFDYALASLRAVSASLYDRAKPGQIAALLRKTEAVGLVAPDALQASAVISESVPTLRFVVVVKGDAPTLPASIRFLSMPELCSLGSNGNARQLEESVLAASPKDPHTIVFTSGTTGEQRGAMLSHRNFVSVVTRWRLRTYGIRPVIVAFLPLAHALQRAAIYRRLFSGYISAYPGGAEHLDRALKDVHPHMFAVVPRILEKMRDKILDHVGRLSPKKRAFFDWALDVGYRWLDAKEKGRLTIRLRLQRWASLLFIKRSIKASLGRRLRYLGCGSAPLDPDLERFFWALGIKILQGYGLTETTAPATVNSPRKHKIGSVGRPLPGVDIKIAEDGEIQIHGDGVFQGYFGDRQATREAFVEGWFRSGDLGRIDEEGFLWITGRKKELIVSTGGKKIAPAAVEAVLRRAKGVQEAMVVGEGRPYLAALVFSERGADVQDVQKSTQEIVTDYNSRHAKFEQIRRFAVIDRELTMEADELTVTLKIRRNVIATKYAGTIDGLYLAKT